jgi:hypothetical protein
LRIGQVIFQIPDLVAAETKACHVITLDKNAWTTEGGRKAGCFDEGSGEQR